MSVLEDSMFYGLKKMISDKTNISAYSEHDTARGYDYVMISLDDIETTLPGAGSSTFVGTFSVDYITNIKNQRTVRNNKSKILEALADNTEYGTPHYYFNGEVQTIEQGEDDDEYVFRVVYNISHMKVS